MAPFMFFTALFSVFPCEMHPGKEGHDATNHPSSSFASVILNFKRTS